MKATTKIAAVLMLTLGVLHDASSADAACRFRLFRRRPLLRRAVRCCRSKPVTSTASSNLRPYYGPKEPTSYLGDNWPIELRRLWGKHIAAASPGWGHCYRCLRTWNACKNHVTQYSELSGCFPLCEPCWKELTPAERLPFYLELIQSWNDSPWQQEPGTKEAIEAAVWAGK